jgi:signal transduction histidine kinase
MGVGPSSAEEAGRIWHEIRTEKKTLQDFLDQYDNMSPSQQQAMVAMAQPMRFSLTETLEVPVACLLKKETITVSDAPRDPGVSARFRQLMGTDQFVAVPLVARGEAIGVLLADNRFSRQPITENSVRLLNIIAARAAMSIANAEAYHRLEEKIQQLAETRDRLVRSERLAAIGNMAAHVAHEIRNPLVTIGGFARAILRDADPSSLCGQHSRIIVDEVTRLEKILANVMNFTKPTPPHRAEANVDEIIDATCSLLADQLKSKNVELVKDLHLGNEKTFIDAAQMKQVFLNVIQNAVDSLEHHGRITIRTEAEDARVRIDISDTGTGMSAEVQESIFLPFFTTKPDGTGLGLAVSRKIVEDHGGDIQVQSTLGAGTTFSIFLPRTGSASSS